MSYFDNTFRPHLRLAILQLLEAQPGYQANDSILVEAAAGLGLRATRDQVRGEIAWLAEQGLLEREELAGRLVLVSATERGCDVAKGLALAPGVKRPGP